MSTVTLSILNGRRLGHRLLLKPRQQIAVGRTEFSDFAIPDDPALSHVHFHMSCSYGGLCEIEDLGSTNGTFVNGKPVTNG